MRLYLIRHGQAEWQVERSGDLDGPLTFLGHQQAGKAARWLADKGAEVCAERRVTRLFTSPLQRATQTSWYFETTMGLKGEVRAELKEAIFRVADQLPRRSCPFSPVTCYTIPVAYKEFKQQALFALKFLFDAADGVDGNVIAITHGGLIKTMLRVVAGSDDLCFDIFNAAVTVLDWRHGRWHLMHLNFWDHLSPEFRSR